MNDQKKYGWRKFTAGLIAGILLTNIITSIRNAITGIFPVENRQSQTQNANTQDLERDVKRAIGGLWANYSILVEDLNSGFRWGINENTVYTAASLNKTVILATLYAEHSKNNLDFERTLTIQENDIQDYGTGSIRYDMPGSTYSVKTLMMLMMKKSDNTAAHILANYVVNPELISRYLASWNMTQTDINSNKTSNNDMLILFRKMFRGEIASAGDQKEMLDLLTDSDFEDRIPARLPAGNTVYHKIGTAVGQLHDTGIVQTNQTAYYIGIMTADINNENAATAKIAEISRLVYDFLAR